MNLLIADSWLREFLDTKATPIQLKECLSLCGPSVERINKAGNDYIYDVEITSNRIDMASVLGIAMEASSILPRFGIPAKLKPPPIKKINFSEVSKILPLQIRDDKHLCYRILSVVMDNITIGKSPDFISNRLEKSGIRSINNCIDITNYVMLELGQPCHVFDYDRIKTGQLNIRNAKKGEKAITLDGKICLVDEQDIIIDDGTGRIIDIPGIMGTQNSVVTPETKRIVFFIESNNPVNIRRTSMKFNLRTMAASINEKHPDPEFAKQALLRGIDLYQKIIGAKIKSGLTDIYPNRTRSKSILISASFINNRLGIELNKKEIINILKSLSFTVSENKNGNEFTVLPPSFRQFDVTIREDIVEEVARIYGYHNLPGNLMEGKIPVNYLTKNILEAEEKIKYMLKDWGYIEIYNYSFISKEIIQKANFNIFPHLKIANPLTSDTEFMRVSLLPSILETTEKNQHNSQSLKLFELAKVYIPQNNDLPKEISMLTVINQTDFLDIKGVTVQLLKDLGVEDYAWKASNFSALHPQQSIDFIKNNNILAQIGKIHPNLQNNFELKNPCFVAILDLEEIFKICSPVKKYKSVPSFPAVFEDITLRLPPRSLVGEIMSEIKKIPFISDVILIDQYSNYLTIKITYQNLTKNLSQIDVKKIRNQLLDKVNQKFKATIKEQDSVTR